MEDMVERFFWIDGFLMADGEPAFSIVLRFKAWIWDLTNSIAGEVHAWPFTFNYACTIFIAFQINAFWQPGKRRKICIPSYRKLQQRQMPRYMHPLSSIQAIRDIWKMINSRNWRQRRRRKIGAKMGSGNDSRRMFCLFCFARSAFLFFILIWFITQLNWWELTIIIIR